MGKWGKNAIVAAVALGCALFVMGIVHLDGADRGTAAGLEQGWKPSQVEQLRQPAPLSPADEHVSR